MVTEADKKVLEVMKEFGPGLASRTTFVREIVRLRELADAANQLANTHFGKIEVPLNQEPTRTRFFDALEAVFGPSVSDAPKSGES